METVWGSVQDEREYGVMVKNVGMAGCLDMDNHFYSGIDRSAAW